VGLHSKSWGRIFIGRQDLHYFNTSNETAVKNSLRSDSVALLAYAGAGATTVANATRTQNVVHYTTPNWSGFTGIIAFSSNPSAFENDIVGGTTSLAADRKGRAWTLNPNYAAANWQVGYSYWNSKPDVGTTAITAAGLAAAVAGTAALPVATANQVAHRLYGHYEFGFGLKVGLAVDWTKLKMDNDLGTSVIGDGTMAKRTAWSIPFRYSFMGKHQISGHYTKAKSDSQLDNFGINNTGANMWALGYAYDLSKRTSIGVTYARINNESRGNYNLFASTSLGLGGSAGILPGEDPRMFGTTIRHAF
jgi:predicted porin